MNRYAESLVGNVEREILPHNSESDESDVGNARFARHFVAVQLIYIYIYFGIRRRRKKSVAFPSNKDRPKKEKFDKTFLISVHSLKFTHIYIYIYIYIRSLSPSPCFLHISVAAIIPGRRRACQSTLCHHSPCRYCPIRKSPGFVSVS